MFSRMLCLALCVFGLLAGGPVNVWASDVTDRSNTSIFATPIYHDPFSSCSKDCSASVFAGRYLHSSMFNVFAIRTFEPIWSYEWRDSELLAGSFSRKILENPGWWSIEGEFGLAKRFGELNAAENWLAVYFRWSAFPWSQKIRTSLAISTGLSYAWSLDQIEVANAINGGRGSHLMHYLSPEITFGLPQHPDWDLFFRLHHRSGGADVIPALSSALFNDAAGGAQYLTTGLRYNF